MKKRHILLFSLVVTAFGGFAWLVLRPPPQPVYEGKPLGYWLRYPTLTPESNLPVLGGVSMRFPKVDSNAIPFLTKALERKDGSFEKQYRKLWVKLPPRFRSHLPKPAFPGEIRGNAASILGKMGTNAKPAIPALISIMKCDESRNARFSAATSLLSIGGGEETVKEAFREVSNDKSQSEGVRIMAQCYLQPARPVAAGSATVAEPDFDILFPGISSIPADQILQIGFPEQQPALHNKPGF